MKSALPDRIPAELTCSQCSQKSKQRVPREDPSAGDYTCPGCGAAFHLTADQAATIKKSFDGLEASIARVKNMFRK